ncbi:hypothetical protein P3T25_009662 [Paraburkholderia sp. GAS32]
MIERKLTLCALSLMPVRESRWGIHRATLHASAAFV